MRFAQCIFFFTFNTLNSILLRYENNLLECNNNSFLVMKKKDFTKNIELAFQDKYIIASLKTYVDNLTNIGFEKDDKLCKINVYLNKSFQQRNISETYLNKSDNNLIQQFFLQVIKKELIIDNIENINKYLSKIQKEKKQKEINKNIEKFLCLAFNHLYQDIINFYSLDYTAYIPYIMSFQSCINEYSEADRLEDNGAAISMRLSWERDAWNHFIQLINELMAIINMRTKLVSKNILLAIMHEYFNALKARSDRNESFDVNMEEFLLFLRNVRL